MARRVVSETRVTDDLTGQRIQESEAVQIKVSIDDDGTTATLDMAGSTASAFRDFLSEPSSENRAALLALMSGAPRRQRTDYAALNARARAWAANTEAGQRWAHTEGETITEPGKMIAALRAAYLAATHDFSPTTTGSKLAVLAGK